ncbi:MAG: TonB-dependent receptor [Gemmatimonadota bacterium]
MRPLILAATFLFATFPLGAQQTSRLVGQVVSSDRGAPLSSVIVQVEGTGVRGSSDAHGGFALSGIPVGPARVSFSRLGYAPVTLELDVTAAGIRDLRVEMARGEVALDPLVVLMTRTRLVGDPLVMGSAPGSAHFLSRADLRIQPLLFDDIHATLRRIPGVNIQDEEGFGLRPNIGLRGTGAERSSKVTLMEDGILVAPAPYSAPAAYYVPTMGRMEGVEVRKGSSQIRYGPWTTGGAINLVSRSIPERLAWEAELSGGAYGSFKGRGGIGGATDHFGAWIETYQVATDGFKELQGGGDTGYRLEDYLARLRANTRRDAPTYQEVELKVGRVEQASDETYLGITDGDFQATPLLRYAGSRLDLMETEHDQLQLRHFLTTSSGFDLTTTLYQNTFARNWYKLQSVGGRSLNAVLDDPEQFPAELAILNGGDSGDNALRIRANNREYLARGIQTVLGVRANALGARHQLELGVRIHEDEEDRFHWEDGYRMTDGVMTLTNPGIHGAQTNRVVDARAIAMYIQDEVRAGRVTLTPGLRYETIDFTDTNWGAQDLERTGPGTVRENSVEAWVPGLGASYEVSPSTHVFGGVHRGFGPPGPGADEETRPESSASWEIGTRYRRGSKGLDLVGFYSHYSNILGAETLASGTPGTGDLFNGGKVVARGIEAAGELDLADGRLTGLRVPLRVTYTFTQAEFRNDFASAFEPWGTVEVGDELPYNPKHQFHGTLGVRGDLWGITLGAEGTGESRTVAGQGEIPSNERTDAHLVFSISGELQIPGMATVFAGIQNLADASYAVSRRPAGLRPGLPRTIQAGVRIGR